MKSVNSLLTGAMKPEIKEIRKKVVPYAKRLHKWVEEQCGIKVHRRIFGSYNPYIEFRPYDKNQIFPNEFRAMIARTLGVEPLNWDDVYYGNVTDRYITLNYSEWIKIFPDIQTTESEEITESVPESEETTETGGFSEGSLYRKSDSVLSDEVDKDIQEDEKPETEDIKFDEEELRKGLEIEREHTDSLKEFLKEDVDIEQVLRAIVLDHVREDPDYYSKLEEKENEKIERNSTIKKVAYVKRCPGHKNSKGEKAEWCIVNHDTGEIISSHKTKEEADEHLKQMYIHKNSSFVSLLV